MEKVENRSNNMLLAFLALLGIILIVALMGFFMMGEKSDMIQGQIEVDEYRLSSKVPGRIQELRVKLGDIVRSGDTLAILDAPNVMAKLQQAKAAEIAAQAQNKKANQSVRAERLQMAYEMWQKSIAGVTVMEKSYIRIKRLNKEGVVTNQQLDEITAKRDAAIATEKAAKAQYEMAKNGAEQEDKLIAKALVERASGAVNEVNDFVNETVLVAMSDGEVSEIFPMLGELVGAGAPIMNIAMNSKKWVSFNVREDKLNGLKIGDEIEGFIPAFNNKKIKMNVVFIKDLGTFATWRATKTLGDFDLKTFQVKAEPIDKTEGLRAGMSVILENKN